MVQALRVDDHVEGQLVDICFVLNHYRSSSADAGGASRPALVRTESNYFQCERRTSAIRFRIYSLGEEKVARTQGAK